MFSSKLKSLWAHTLNMTSISVFATFKKVLVVIES